MCAMLLPNMPKFPLYELSCLIFFLVPMLSIAVLYMRMGLRIQSNGLGRSIEGSVHGETRQAQSRKAIIRMLSKFPSFRTTRTHADVHVYRTRAYIKKRPRTGTHQQTHLTAQLVAHPVEFIAPSRRIVFRSRFAFYCASQAPATFYFLPLYAINNVR